MLAGLSVDQIVAVITAASTVILALLGAVALVLTRIKELRKELGYNTFLSRGSKDAANHLAEQIQITTAERARLTYLERFYAAAVTFAECEPCVQRIVENIDTKRIRASDSKLTQEMMQKWQKDDQARLQKKEKA